MKSPALSVLIPAAGSSERLGQAKQLLRFKGKTLLHNTVDHACSIAAREIIVVTGAHARMIEDALPSLPVRWIHNPQWANGMGGSIALGAAAITTGSAGVMILLCDQWGIRSADLELLVETWQSNPQRIVCANAGDTNMPPVIFPATCFRQLSELEGKYGARSLLAAMPELTTAIPLKRAAIDLDTPAQLDELRKL